MKSMEALKCDFCGGGLIIDDSREFAKCEFCGTKYMASTLRAKIQEIKGTVKVEGAVETITGNAEKERLIKNAETLLKLEKFEDAEKIIKDITNQFPDDYRGWFYRYQLSLMLIIANIFRSFYNGKPQYNSFPYSILPKTDDKSLKTAVKLCPDSSIINQFFFALANNYGSDLHIIRYSEADDYDYNQGEFSIIDINGKTVNSLTIDNYTAWLLFSSDETSKVLKDPKFDNFRNKVAQLYVTKIQKGIIIPYTVKDNHDRWLLEPITSNKVKLSVERSMIFSYLRQLPGAEYSKHSYGTGYTEKLSIGKISFNKTPNPYDDEYFGFFLYGMYIFINEYSTIGDYLLRTEILKLPKLITFNDIYKANDLCQYCGGNFKGVFSKTCSRCGKQKDY